MRKLKNLDVRELSIIIGGRPAVPGAKLLVAKGEIPFYEKPEVLEALRALDGVVGRLKADQLAKEEARLRAELQQSRRRLPQRIRSYEDSEGYTPEQLRARDRRITESIEGLPYVNRDVINPATGKPYRKISGELF